MLPGINTGNCMANDPDDSRADCQSDMEKLGENGGGDSFSMIARVCKVGCHQNG